MILHHNKLNYHWTYITDVQCNTLHYIWRENMTPEQIIVYCNKWSYTTTDDITHEHKNICQWIYYIFWHCYERHWPTNTLLLHISLAEKFLIHTEIKTLQLMLTKCPPPLTSGSSPWWCNPRCVGMLASAGTSLPWRSNLAGWPVCQNETNTFINEQLWKMKH